MSVLFIKIIILFNIGVLYECWNEHNCDFLNDVDVLFFFFCLFKFVMKKCFFFVIFKIYLPPLKLKKLKLIKFNNSKKLYGLYC